MMVVPHPDLAIEGTIALGRARVIELSGARGGQTHLWGAKHASRWCWLHASDLEGLDGAPRARRLDRGGVRRHAARRARGRARARR